METKFKITERDIRLTIREKIDDFVGTNRIAGMIIFPFYLLILILILPFLIFFQYVFEKVWGYDLFYKSIQYHSLSNFPDYLLSIDINFQEISLIEGYIERLMKLPGMKVEDLGEMNIGLIRTAPPIPDLEAKHFDHCAYAFEDYLFVLEVELPKFKTNLGCIDCEELNYIVIKKFEDYPTLSFKERDGALDIIVRQHLSKKKITIENMASGEY